MRRITPSNRGLRHESISDFIVLFTARRLSIIDHAIRVLYRSLRLRLHPQGCNRFCAVASHANIAERCQTSRLKTRKMKAILFDCGGEPEQALILPACESSP